MDEVVERFNRLKRANPHTGNVLILAQIVSEHSLTKRQIKKYLHLLCRKDYDYFEDEKGLIDFLYSFSKK
ncbi:hypothetical protein TAGGR_1602 [Thermodesulfovibrio aggregans]|uniref:Uncharacterized protein n=1 Tax=Thermodesulfovibrio aggregans TaxID=86166 RepID=A0A0U9I992_9BACT|nr:hypothetical protein [Thermodesulfovibrio aggregans]GAQ94422.1 hypothetical protein TAGGR_1602 [Thermodesulfovibrio aggregans]